MVRLVTDIGADMGLPVWRVTKPDPIWEAVKSGFSDWSWKPLSYSIRFNTSCADDGRSMMTLSPSTRYLAPSRLASGPYQTSVS